jgi:Abnormal spindle-like microcephaly-assoc'd, ASPM-SPD-2-Hydin
MMTGFSRSYCAVRCLAAMLFIVLPTFSVAQSTLHVYREVQRDVSPPLAELIRMTPAQPNPFSPRILDVLPTGPDRPAPLSPVPDAALQEQVLPLVSATVGLNFEGLGLGQYGFNLQAAPPDTNGVVGATQYVQWVNLEFAVFNKNTGALVAGPTPGNAIWAGFGGSCQTNNSGDPIVQYDKMANRWILTQFAVGLGTPPFLQCVAVSTTSDATGTYNRYAFAFGNQFNDYPKLGVWPDAYYMSFNNFLNGNVFTGPNACAMDRTAMLAGTAATIICFQQANSFTTLLPSDMDGTIQPTPGEAAFFMDFGANKLNLWKFHADFAVPANSTFTGPTAVTVAAFTPGCNRTCVAQPGTANRLDMLGDRLMYRLAYRKFADGHEALVVSHSITTGYRWYELRDPNGTPTVFQQGTFAPDANTRWMGSIAMDQSGNIGLGYTLGSSTVFPSVFFTGRTPADPLGTMEAEQAIVNGSGSQTSPTRWGDYSAMTIDPADDCTFWYTQEYSKTTGSFSWNTRIANFKFANCGGQGGPAVTLSTAKLTFKKTLIGVTSPPQTVTLTNTGAATLHISSITASGDFAISNNTCGATVAAGANCAVSVTFKPTNKGTRKGSLTFTDDAPNSPQIVALVGTGMAIMLTPSSLNFGTVTVGQTSTPQSVTVSNVATFVVTFTSFGFAGTSALDYSITNNTCGPTIAGGANCAVTIVFKPTVKGKRNATFQVKDNGGGNPQTAKLTGVGG